MRPEAESRTAVAVCNVWCLEQARVCAETGASGGSGATGVGDVRMHGVSGRCGGAVIGLSTPGDGAISGVGATPGGVGMFAVVLVGRSVMYWRTMH